MAYSYQLGYLSCPPNMVFHGGQGGARNDEGRTMGSYWVAVTAEFDLATLAELKARVKQDTGFVPDWLETCPRAEYIGVEHEYQVDGNWFIAVIEGSESHVLPTLEQRAKWREERKAAENG